MHAARSTAAAPQPGLSPAMVRRARGHARPLRRDARRFGLAMPRNDIVHKALAAPLSTRFDGLRMFAHTFAAGFLFTTVFLA